MNIKNLTKSKYRLLRHLGYFLAAPGMLILWLFCLLFTIIICILLIADFKEMKLHLRNFMEFTIDFST